MGQDVSSIPCISIGDHTLEVVDDFTYLGLKAGECPAPQSEVTVWKCDVDEDCEGNRKCCTEGVGQLCRHPAYVTRFQVLVAIATQWMSRYSNLSDAPMMGLKVKLTDHFRTLEGFQNLTIRFARKPNVKVTIEVVASPKVCREKVQQAIGSLRNTQVLFDGAMRQITNTSLVTHSFCGSLGCGTGGCIRTSKGARCLCPKGVYGDRCQFSDPCEGGMCQNGGTCNSTLIQGESGLEYQYTCLCPSGYMGSACEVSVCSVLPENICNSGMCLGHVDSGQLCSCPLNRRGIFCKDIGTELPYTECEQRQRLNRYLAEVLSGKITMATDIDAGKLQTILQRLGMEWLPQFSCQHGGAYSLTVELLSVEDKTTVRHTCLDENGVEEPDCQSKVCSTLSVQGLSSLCQNGGVCIGNINGQLCNCTGTGHHGAVCDKDGEDDSTECEQKHDLTQLTLDALSGSLELSGLTGQKVKTIISALLQEIHVEVIWQPDCTRGGSHAYRGCEFQVSNMNSKECFCVDEWHNRLDSVPSSTAGLPNCPVARGACSEFTSDPCGEHGTCIGDLNGGAMCECADDYSGMLCQVNEPATKTDCQQQRELSNHLLSIMHDFQQPPLELSSSVQQLLTKADIQHLKLPSCDATGLYKYICTYSVDPLVLDECRCTNEDGTYSSEGSSCGEITKPGECPDSDGVVETTAKVCSADLDCDGSKKCCSAGTRLKCRDPVYVSLFQVEITINTPWRSEYSNLLSSSMNNIKTQLEDVCRTLTGFMGLAIIASRQGSVKLTVEVKASAELTAEEILITLEKLKGFQLTIGGKTLEVTSAIYVTPGVCEGVECSGPNWCVGSSFGARCACLPGASGNMCQYSTPACNCSESKQCLRGSQPGALACSCYPEYDANCTLALWYCAGKPQTVSCSNDVCAGEQADCSGSEKCVHRQDCDVGTQDCGLTSSCIPLEQEHPCDDQPCRHGGMCVVKGGGAYMCQCPQNFTGTHCEKNAEICQVVPSTVCTHGCVGDIHVGALCQCPDGRGGINCDRPAHTQCERRVALTGDMLKAFRLELTVPDVTKTQLHNMVLTILDKMGMDVLPQFNCTADGSYMPLQCNLHLQTQQQTCHCIDRAGAPISSNVQAYPGFPPCTAPYSPVVTGEMLCSTSLSSVCRNGGTCVGNLFNGTMCHCTTAYTGIFCQDRKTAGQTSEPPESLCEFSLEVWQLMREVVTSGDRTFITQLQVLQNKLFHAYTNMPNEMIKAACMEDGRFEPVQCTFNLRSDQPVACYCINPKGVILSSKTTWPQKPQCSEISGCPSRACSLTSCEHGLALDIHGCEICQCRHPCDGQCAHDPDLRCVVETQDDCGRDNWEGACSSGICRHRQKPGMCPASVMSNITILETLQSSKISSCNVDCLDDADCPANLKCCGVCGMQCVQPVGEYTCETHRSSAVQEFEFLKQLLTILSKNKVRLRLASRIVRAKLEELSHLEDFWLPTCDSDGFYRLTQCKTLISQTGNSQSANTAGCFCVDRHGNHIPGTNAATKDETNCEAKPGSCPFLQPNASALHGCQSDYDCQDERKCCPNGLGSQCIAPLMPEEGAAISLDDVLADACSFLPSACGVSGACVRRWYTEGKMCACNQGYHGSFCQLEGNEEAGMTPCRRRRLMKEYLLDNLEELDLFIREARRGGSTAALVFTFPDCLPDGDFAPFQCNTDMDTKQKLDCFCVTRKGQPMAGTSVPAGLSPPCARSNPCDLGEPLRQLGNDTLVPCGGRSGQCISGYLCRAGRYGEFSCCRDRLSKTDVCLLPPNPGSNVDCDQQQNQQRFYFDVRDKRCKAFTYTGCSDYNSNFDTKTTCEARCVRKEHQGRCPAKTVVAERASCTDTCRGDADCSEEQKCCSSSCGRHCVLALNSGGAECGVGQPLVDTETNEPLSCSSNQNCGPGYLCHKGSCCIHRMDKVCHQPRLSGPCKAGLTRYFYNTASGQCESFLYGGCGANDNNFLTKDDCCRTCGGEGRCKDGVCPAPRPVLSVSCDRNCFGDGDCSTNQICCNTSCGGSACVIAKPSSENALSCRDHLTDYLQQMTWTKSCYLRHRPRCGSDGNWQRQQCNDKLGVCWCVTPNGFVVPRTRVRGVAQCQWVTPVMMEAADKRGMQGDDIDEDCQVCPGGEEVQCCTEDLCLQACPSNPTAVCRINPCGGCRAVFYNAENDMVDCTEGLTVCQLHRHNAMKARYQHSILALAASRRQNNMAPNLMTATEDNRNQAPYVVDGIPYKCQLKPETGDCLAHSPQWFYNITSRRCEVFLYGQCGGNDNRFVSPQDCYDQCNTAASPCHGKACTDGKACHLKYRTDCFSGTCGLTTDCRASHQSQEVYVPQCNSDGVYAFKQCHDKVCWCVSASGAKTNGPPTTSATLQCNSKGPTRAVRNPVACPNSKDSASAECADRCRDALCPGHPSARCVVDLCTCETTFINTNGKPVTCKNDICQTNVFVRAENPECSTDKVCGGNGPKGCEYRDPCSTAVCPNNPCAVCVSDSCSGQVTFIDKLTNKPVPKQACSRVEHTSCQIRRCEVMSQNARASHNDTLLVLPECEEDGSYKPQQPGPDDTVYCVDDFGQPVETKASECVRDPLVKISVAVIYEGVFEKIVPPREGKIIQAFTNLMEKIGLLKDMVTNVKVRPGSIIIETVIVKHPDSPMDLAVVKALIQSKAASGELTLHVDRLVLKVVSGEAVLVTPTTASQLESGVSQGGIRGGAVAAIVIVVLLIAGGAGGAAFYFLYYRRRQNSEDNTDAPHGGVGKGEMTGVGNSAFNMYSNVKIGSKSSVAKEDFVEEPVDDHYVKVRL